MLHHSIRDERELSWVTSHLYVNEIKKGLAATPAIHLRLLNNWLISGRGVFLLVTLNYTFYTFNYPIILHGKLGLNHSGLNLVLVEHRGGESHRLVVVYELVYKVWSLTTHFSIRFF